MAWFLGDRHTKRRVVRLVNQKYSVVYSEGSIATLKEWLERGIPLILFVYTGELTYWTMDTAHAVIAVGFEFDDIVLVDPAIDAEYLTVASDELMLAWSRFDYTFAVIQAHA